MRNRVSMMATAVLLIVGAAGAYADVKLPALFSDGMVVQQAVSARIWGWAEPGESVAVEVGWSTAVLRTIASEDGRWSLDLPPAEAGGPFTISVEGTNRITLSNVLVGEVWICSGQSNMEMGLKDAGIWHKGVLDEQQEIASANYPEIRFFTVERNVALQPQTDCKGEWLTCTPDSVAEFSATAYFYGRYLHRKLGVPVGLIHSSWGGTRAEAWTPRETLAALSTYADELAEQWAAPSGENVKAHRTAEEKRNSSRFLLDAQNVGFGKGYAKPDFDASDWQVMNVPASWESSSAEMAGVDGVVWFRKKISIPASWSGRNLVLSLGTIEDCDTTYFNGCKLGGIGYGTDRYWKTPRTYQVPASFVRAGEDNVIAIRVFDDAWNGGLTGKPEDLTLRPADVTSCAYISLVGLWQYRLENVLEPNPIRLAHANCPAVLFDGMINPLIPYSIRGFIWYQGESNHTNGRRYRKLFPAMIESWRHAWHRSDLPFYYVQIAPFNYAEPNSAPELREAQLMTLSIPHTGMAVTTDIAEPDDVHPRNKQEVGRRLALWSLAKTYGREGQEYSGPLYSGMEIDGSSVRIRFDHAESGLVAKGGPLTDFMVAGKDRVFVPAIARIDGSKVVVSAAGVTQPVAVRFAWSNSPTPNLFNKDGLPASPFRTDDWLDAVKSAAAVGEGLVDTAPSNAPVDASVTVDVNDVQVDDFLGVGVEWSAYPWWDISQQDWEKVFRRVEFMRLPLSRVMLDTFWYCRGFDNEGRPVYDWNTSFMKKLYTLLDWCQRNDTTVIIGEWGRPNGKDLDLPADDPRWTRIISDFVEYMLDEKGYTCIKYYNIINEPHGSWSGVNWDEWYSAITGLQNEFKKRGLLERIAIAAPDGDRRFTTRCLKDDSLRALTGIYDEHWYVRQIEVENGILELYAREQLRQINDRDPGKQFVLGELGLVDGKTENDQQPHVYDFWYGVSMADAALQLIRGGVSGFIAWDLDDSMHFCGDGGESMNSLSDPLPENAYERRKVWGFWNILGAENGMPEDERMRPWFCSWAMLSRVFPPGCQTLDVEDSGVGGLRVAGARIPAGSEFHLSLALTNNSEWPRRVRIAVPGVLSEATFAVYEYFDSNGDNLVDAWPRVVDSNENDIFPQLTAVVKDVDLRDGFTVSLPSKGLAVLTTLDHGAPVSVGRMSAGSKSAAVAAER